MLTVKKQGFFWRKCLFLSLACAAFFLCLSQGTSYAASGEVVVNLNTATAGEFTKIPGIGEKKGEAIVKYRDENGPFKTVEDIQKVKGIGAKLFEKIKAHITVEGATAPKKVE